MAECEGRQFVDVKDFLKCYPNSSVQAKQILRDRWKNQCVIEKRNDDILFQMMRDICWSAFLSAHVSPLVLKDGWVFWLDGKHPVTIRLLGGLLFGSSDWSFSDSKNDNSLFSEGAGWYVSTMDPRVIQCGSTYKTTKGDEAIFSTFRRYDIC